MSQIGTLQLLPSTARRAWTSTQQPENRVRRVDGWMRENETISMEGEGGSPSPVMSSILPLLELLVI